MSLYSEQLAKLKKAIAIISTQKSKRFTKNQKIMINFIQGKTSKAEFIINDKKIILFAGDEKKGFRHILEKHYCDNSDSKLTTMDILNISDVAKRGFKLANEGVSNHGLTVFMSLKNQKEHRLVLKEQIDESFVVTFYKKS